jgi:hypothetical protein
MMDCINNLINILTRIVDNKNILNPNILQEILITIDKMIEIFINDDLYLRYLEEKNSLYIKSISNNDNDISDMINIINEMIVDLNEKYKN